MTTIKSNKMQHTIVSSDWLYEHLNHPDLLIFDASIPKVTSNSQEQNLHQIKGAQFFDIKHTFSDTSAPFPNTFPSESKFENEGRQLGVHTNSIIVVYDDKGIYSSARAWWLFKTFGHETVYVLDGGLPEWKQKGYPLEEKQPNKKPLGNFKALYNSKKIVFFNDFAQVVDMQEATIIDARSSDRYNSAVPEPRKGLRSGRVACAINIPYASLLHNGKLKTKAELKQLLSPLLNTSNSVITYCGSGVTACVIVLAAEYIGYSGIKVYDGSWTEFGSLVKE